MQSLKMHEQLKVKSLQDMTALIWLINNMRSLLDLICYKNKIQPISNFGIPMGQ